MKRLQLGPPSGQAPPRSYVWDLAIALGSEATAAVRARNADEAAAEASTAEELRAAMDARIDARCDVVLRRLEARLAAAPLAHREAVTTAVERLLARHAHNIGAEALDELAEDLRLDG